MFNFHHNIFLRIVLIKEFHYFFLPLNGVALARTNNIFFLMQDVPEWYQQLSGKG
jgi:hypothetical protein